jgi:hypothetical protein
MNDLHPAIARSVLQDSDWYPGKVSKEYRDNYDATFRGNKSEDGQSVEKDEPQTEE